MSLGIYCDGVPLPALQFPLYLQMSLQRVIFIFVSVYATCRQVPAEAREGLDPLELQDAVCYLTGVLGTKLGSSGRAASTLNL